MLPLMGAILIPLSLAFWSKPERLLKLVIIAGIFPAAAVLQLGGFCLQPTLAPGLTFISYIVLQKLLGVRYPGEASVRTLSMGMLFNLIWAVLGSQIMPRLFRNEVLVWPQKQDAAGTLSLLAPNFGNITQDAYLIINVVLMVLTAQYLTRRNLDIAEFYKTYVFTGWLLVGICVWQFAARTVHVPFPRSFFYSNTGWSVLDAQTAGPVPRINASFTEPAACASYLAGVVFSTIWLTLKGYRVRGMRALIWASSIALCLTTSTTGFGAIAVGLILLPVLVVLTGHSRLLGRIGQLAMIGALILGVAGATVATFSPKVITAAQSVASGTAEKKQSASYQERSQVDLDSMAAFRNTYGLGTGWGSNRSSSLIPGLLATIGIIGVICLLVFDWQLAKAAGWAIRVAPLSMEGMAIEGFLAAIVGRLIAAILSSPTIGMPDFYVMLGIVIAAISRIKLEAWSRGTVTRSHALERHE
ncbi:hypothetical protein LWC05_01000 [Acetobacter sicerae]|uniref:O-antigen ligase domain-containing protein n=1 Tax=Acetobacter sicerae TaxID=85325 RepID=A0ABS8VU91_9PROT|nr:hypothetical protein [Acetobacter sicerae]MCE0742477.1 hypothetical protein [Acetobacter sicerae]